MYDPVIGRFTTIDPELQFFSPYIAYGNNPINVVDPDGAFSDPVSNGQVMSSFAMAIFKAAENKAQFLFLKNFVGTQDQGTTVENINVKVHVERFTQGGVTFDFNGKNMAATVKWNGESKMITRFEFHKKTFAGQGALKNTIVFYGGAVTENDGQTRVQGGGIVGFLTFDKASDFNLVESSFNDYVNSLVKGKVENATIEQAVNEDRRDKWVDYYDQRGTTDNFIIDNVQAEKPFSLWDWIFGSDGDN